MSLCVALSYKIPLKCICSHYVTKCEKVQGVRILLLATVYHHERYYFYLLFKSFFAIFSPKPVCTFVCLIFNKLALNFKLKLCLNYSKSTYPRIMVRSWLINIHCIIVEDTDIIKHILSCDLNVSVWFNVNLRLMQL